MTFDFLDGIRASRWIFCRINGVWRTHCNPGFYDEFINVDNFVFVFETNYATNSKDYSGENKL